MLNTALVYAARGWPVLPVHGIKQGKCSCRKSNCTSPGKHPLTRHGLKDATTDKAKITQWWQKWPHANIGIVTGEVSGLVVLDIDPDKGGYESLQDLIDLHAPLPETLSQITGSGGKHYLFKYPDNPIGNSVSKLGKGIDIRGDGGYIVVAPSNYISGGSYSWQSDVNETELADMPEWLLILTNTVESTVDDKNPDTVTEGYRNNYLMSKGGILRREGKRKREILTYLLEENQLRCNPPMDYDEVKKIADSLGRYRIGNAPKEMKYRYIDWLRSSDSPVPGITRHILLDMTNWMNKDGRSCFPTIPDIAATTGYSESTVKKHLTKAVESDWIGRYPHKGEGQQWRNYGYFIPPDLLKVGYMSA